MRTLVLVLALLLPFSVSAAESRFLDDPQALPRGAWAVGGELSLEPFSATTGAAIAFSGGLGRGVQIDLRLYNAVIRAGSDVRYTCNPANPAPCGDRESIGQADLRLRLHLLGGPDSWGRLALEGLGGVERGTYQTGSSMKARWRVQALGALQPLDGPFLAWARVGWGAEPMAGDFPKSLRATAAIGLEASVALGSRWLVHPQLSVEGIKASNSWLPVAIFWAGVGFSHH